MRASLRPPIYPTTVVTIIVTTIVTHTRCQPNSALTPPPSDDLICNNGTEYVCVCDRYTGALDDRFPPCERLIKVKQLPVVTMKMRHVNLSARARNKEEVYEALFKQRVANMVSKYCERRANDCQETTLRLHKVVVHSSQAQSHKQAAAAAAAAISTDASQPHQMHHENNNNTQSVEQHSSRVNAPQKHPQRFLTQENVIVLSVRRNDSDNTSTVSFAITKTRRDAATTTTTTTGSDDGGNSTMVALQLDTVLDANTTRRILAAQRPTLSRLLGGITIDDIGVSVMKRSLSHADTDNTRLLILLAITGLFFSVTYIIATIKVCRECHERRKAKKRNESLAGGKKSNDYGSCKNQNDVADGKNVSPTQKQVHKPNRTTSLDMYDVNSTPQKTTVIDQRSLNRMFQCDPSQLPAEEEFSLTPTSSRSSPSQRNSRSQPTQRAYEEINEEVPIEMAVNEPKSLIVVQYNSTDRHPYDDSPPEGDEARIWVNSDSKQSLPNRTSSADNDETLRRFDEPEFGQVVGERRRSRRGSRHNEDLLEKILLANPNSFGERLGEQRVMRSRTAHKFGHWSSDSEEDERNNVYYKLSECDEGDVESVRNRVENGKKQPNTRRPPNSGDSSSDRERSADEEEEMEKSANFNDNHLYERLQESPSSTLNMQNSFDE